MWLHPLMAIALRFGDCGMQQHLGTFREIRPGEGSEPSEKVPRVLYIRSNRAFGIRGPGAAGLMERLWATRSPSKQR